jgi:hypothetical protein
VEEGITRRREALFEWVLLLKMPDAFENSAY